MDALAPAVRPGGHVVVGEPFWRRLPLPEDYERRSDPWTTLEGTVIAFETSGLPVVSVIASSEDDWDRYEALHWQSCERARERFRMDVLRRFYADYAFDEVERALWKGGLLTPREAKGMEFDQR